MTVPLMQTSVCVIVRVCVCVFVFSDLVVIVSECVSVALRRVEFLGEVSDPLSDAQQDPQVV